MAPLTFGAGVKGKVLQSMAAGLPCVCTEIAAEGLGLPVSLRSLVEDTAEGIAQLIVKLHDDYEFNVEMSRAAVSFMSENYSVDVVDMAMKQTIGLA